MEEAFLLSDQAASKGIVSISKATDTDYVLLQTIEGLTVINFKTKKSEMVIKSTNWSKKLPLFYSVGLKSILVITDDARTVLQYKPAKSSGSSPFKDKPTRYTLDEKVSEVNIFTEELKFSSGNSYTVSQLISETMDTEKMEHPENEIPEIIEFCKLNTKIYSESLVFDRFFAYTDCSTPAVLKLMDVDFQKIVFESEKQDSSVIKMCCFDSYCIYVTKNKKFYLRDITSPHKATLASVLKQQLTLNIEDQTAIFYKAFRSSISDFNGFKNFVISERTLNKITLFKFFKNLPVATAFEHLDHLFAHLKIVNSIAEGFYFEELIFWISLIIDSKLQDLLLVDEADIRNKLEALQEAIDLQNEYFDHLEEASQLILPAVVAQQSGESRSKTYPEPWDTYSITEVQY